MGKNTQAVLKSIQLFVQISEKYGFQTYSQRPKTQRSVFRQRRNPNKGLFELAVFGFRSFGPGLYCSVPNYFEQTKVSEIRTDCSNFRHKFTSLHICVWNPNILFRLSYMCSDFRHFCLFQVIWYLTEGDCLKSEHVRISDVYCSRIYDVIIPHSKTVTS